MTTRSDLRIVHVDAESGFSGGEVQVFLLLEGLARRGHDNLLICPPGSASEAQARRRGIEVRTVPMGGDLDLRAVLALAREFTARAAELVHLHTGRATWLGALAARRAGLPAISTRRMDRPVKRSAKNRLLHGRLLRRVVAISPAVEQLLREGGVPGSKLRTIPSAVDPESVRSQAGREAVRAQLELDPRAPVLLTLGSLVPRKGLDVLLRALARLDVEPAPVLLVAGDEPGAGAGERTRLETLAAESGLSERVRFLGRRADRGDLLAACDVFLMPSLREGLGVAALEAMAAGRPVVASRVGGLGAAVVHGRTGLLVPPGEPAALADALSRLLGDRERLEALGRAGPGRIAEGFLPQQMVEAYEELYREVLWERLQS